MLKTMLVLLPYDIHGVFRCDSKCPLYVAGDDRCRAGQRNIFNGCILATINPDYLIQFGIWFKEISEVKKSNE